MKNLLYSYIFTLLCITTTVNAQQVTNQFNTVENLAGLRKIEGQAGETIYVESHTKPGDGGNGFFTWVEHPMLKDTLDYFSKDNNGTLIKAETAATGRWVRQYDGNINVKWFAPKYGDATKAFQSAIDFAHNNARPNTPTTGCHVFIPSGGYILDSLLLYTGIEITGDSAGKTILYARLPEEGGNNEGYLFSIAEGPVSISVSNLSIVGRNSGKGCFHFEAQPEKGERPHGGLWLSSFKNINISGFAGNALYLEGGAEGELLPNQFLLFEMMHINLSPQAGADACALKMTGQNGQVTFINTAFNGYGDNGRFHSGRVAEIAQSNKHISAVVSFINASFQEGNYGLYIDNAENIKVSNCWFESLGVAVTVDGSKHLCRGISIDNNRFANAAGFGSLTVPEENLALGSCIDVINSVVSVTNNFTLVSQKTSQSTDDYFIRATGANGEPNPGIITYGNTYSIPELGSTKGMVPTVKVSNGTLDFKANKIIYAEAGGKNITILKGSINAGETLYVIADSNTIIFKNSGSIALGSSKILKLKRGATATFVKTDDTGKGVYTLVSVTP